MKKDYIMRYYVIMIVRSLMTNKIEVSDFSSKRMEKECKQIIELLKTDCSNYYKTAKEIILKTLGEETYANRPIDVVLRSAEFCKRINENTRIYIDSLEDVGVGGV